MRRITMERSSRKRTRWIMIGILAVVVSICSFMPIPGHAAPLCDCDLDNDGSCNMFDWLFFGKNWGRANCPIP